MNIDPILKAAFAKIVEPNESLPDMEGFEIERMQQVLDDKQMSGNEKALYLLLNRFPGAFTDYRVYPHERVRVSNVHTTEPPGYCDYILDFAVYAGSEDRPTKIAVECDGKRSHGERHAKRDQKKDINLQAAGWIVLRAGSRQIHEELEMLANGDLLSSKIVDCIENIVRERAKPITGITNLPPTVHARLVGYTAAICECDACGVAVFRYMELDMKCYKCGKDWSSKRQYT